MSFTHRNRGFTLIELLVVITIIGILSSVVLASLAGTRKQGRDSRRISDINQIQLALELYYDACGYFPSDIYAARSSDCTTSSGGLAPDYISNVPKDPDTGNAYGYVALKGNAISNTALTCASYHVGAKLEASNPSGFASDSDGCVGGTYGAACSGQGTYDGDVCTGSSWTGTSPAANNSDFSGADASLIYDKRP